jgi:hypothetical protein
MNELYFVFIPIMKGAKTPMYCYTLAESEEEAIRKAQIRWEEYDLKIIAKKVSKKKLDELVIATDYFE